MRTKIRGLDLLTAGFAMAAPNGTHRDGGGLELLKHGVEGASWLFRFVSPEGRRRVIGLGGARLDNETSTAATMVAVRAAAVKARTLLACGLDPWSQREQLRVDVKEARAGQMAQMMRTLAEAAREYHARVIAPCHGESYSKRWIGMLEMHVPSRIWNKLLNDIRAPELLRALGEIRASKNAAYLPAGKSIPMTVRRIRSALDRVFDDALFFGRCTSNPAAAVKRKLGEGEAVPIRGHYAALPYLAMPSFYARLLQVAGTVARCMEFTVLTASRKIETTKAQWSEFKLEEGIWMVPGARMKGRKDHLVFLSDRAIEIVRAQRGIDSVYVFGSMYSRMGTPRHVTESSLRMMLNRLNTGEKTTLHGLCRATFSTWAYETTNTRADVIEACLAHAEHDRVKAAYNRSDFQANRRGLLMAWDEFVNPKAETNVASIKGGRIEPVRLVASQVMARPAPFYLRMPDVMERVKLCQASIYTKVREGKFPKPVKFGPMNGWLESEVLEWMRLRVQRPGRVPTAILTLP